MRSALISSILLALSFVSIGKPGLSQSTEEVRNLQFWLGLEADGHIGPQTRREIERQSQVRGLPGDFWSLYNWVEEASENCRAPLPDGVNIYQELLEAIHDLPNPEDTRFRNLEFTDVPATRLTLALISTEQSIYEYTINDFINWSREETLNFMRRVLIEDGQINGLCGELNTQNLYGAYTGYVGFVAWSGRVSMENGSPFDRLVFSSMCRMTVATIRNHSIEDACGEFLLRPEEIEARISEIVSNFGSSD